MRIVICIIILLFFNGNIYSQIFRPENPVNFKNSYLNYLLHSDSTNKTILLNVGYEYLYIPRSNTFTTNGTSFKIGLNLVRFFSKKFIFGVCFDFKYINGFSKQNFSRDFVNDFNSNFNSTYNSETDSAKAYIVYNSINGNSKYVMKGNNFTNIGIEFSPFPNKFGGILLQVKMGFRDYLINGVKGNEFVSNKDLDRLPFALKDNYSLQLSFKPYRFFNSKIIDVLHMKFKDLYKFIVISFYYEKLNIKNSNFDGMRLDQMVNQSFINKYGNANSYGVKLGLAIY
jgi:hypothetical protein